MLFCFPFFEIKLIFFFFTGMEESHDEEADDKSDVDFTQGINIVNISNV